MAEFPSRGTDAAHHELHLDADGRSSLAMPIAAEPLPPLAGELYGRDSELALLEGLLSRSELRLITLVGPDGIGKTSLAVAAARAFAATVGLPAVVVGAAGVDIDTGVLALVAQALGLAPQRGDIEELVFASIGARRMLLLLDDLPAGDDVRAAVDRLCERCPAVQLLVTAREPLSIDGEHAITLEPLALPDGDSWQQPAELERDAAVRLFVDRARAVQPGFQLTLANAVSVAELCRRLGGVPLAIAVVAARSRSFPPSSLLARLGPRLQRETGVATAATRQQILSSAIQWSIDELDDAERSAVARLAVFSGAFDARAAAHVMTSDERATRELLASLAAKALLAPAQASPVEARWRMPLPIRAAARELLRQLGHDAAIQERHAAWYRDAAHAAAAEYRGARQRHSLSRLTLDSQDLRTALDWFYDSGDVRAVLEMASDLGRFWGTRALVGEGIAWLERGLEAAPGVEQAIIARARDELSWLYVLRGDIGRAVSTVAENLDTYRALGDDHGEAGTLDTLGELAINQREFSTAAAHLDRSLRLWRALGEPWRVGMALISAGTAELNLGNVERARACYDEALELLAASGDRRAEAVARVGDGWRRLAIEDLVGARDSFAAALRVLRDLELPLETAEALEGLAAVADRAGDRNHATLFLAAAWRARREVGISPAFLSRLGVLDERERLRARLEPLVRRSAETAAPSPEALLARVDAALATHG